MCHGLHSVTLRPSSVTRSFQTLSSIGIQCNPHKIMRNHHHHRHHHRHKNHHHHQIPCLEVSKTLIFYSYSIAYFPFSILYRGCNRLEAFKMWTWRRMVKVSWTEYKTYDEVLETIGEERSLTRTIRSRHTLRGESPSKTVIEGKM